MAWSETWATLAAASHCPCAQRWPGDRHRGGPMRIRRAFKEADQADTCQLADLPGQTAASVRRGGRCTYGTHGATLIGVNPGTDQFRTAPAKEHLVGLCRFFADVIRDYIFAVSLTRLPLCRKTCRLKLRTSMRLWTRTILSRWLASASRTVVHTAVLGLLDPWTLMNKPGRVADVGCAGWLLPRSSWPTEVLLRTVQEFLTVWASVSMPSQRKGGHLLQRGRDTNKQNMQLKK